MLYFHARATRLANKKSIATPSNNETNDFLYAGGFSGFDGIFNSASRFVSTSPEHCSSQSSSGLKQSYFKYVVKKRTAIFTKHRHKVRRAINNTIETRETINVSPNNSGSLRSKMVFI